MAFTLLMGAVIVILCIVASKFSHKFGMPSLLLFMALGMLFGSDGIFKIELPSNSLAVMIKRKDESNLVPNGDTMIKEGDTLVISDFESSI